MLVDIMLAYAAGLVMTVVYFRFRDRNKHNSTDEYESFDGVQGIDVHISNKKIKQISSRSEIKELRQKYPQAAKEYKENLFDTTVDPVASRRLLRNIISCKLGLMECKLGEFGCSAEFSNGDVIWIKNKYYLFGHFTSSSVPRMVKNNYRMQRYDEYTFLTLVDFIEEMQGW